MAVFQSRYRELSFYVNGELHAFSGGSFATDDAEIIAVLSTISDAVCVDDTEVTDTAEPAEVDTEIPVVEPEVTDEVADENAAEPGSDESQPEVTEAAVVSKPARKPSAK